MHNSQCTIKKAVIWLFHCVPILSGCIMHCASVNAQANRVMNLPKYDAQPMVYFAPNVGMHFGFSLGVSSARFLVQLRDDFRTYDSIYVVTPDNVAGLNLGIVSDLHLGDHWNIRFIPSLAFTQRNITYSLRLADSTFNPVVKKVESTYLEFPLDLKLKSDRIGNYRIYVLAGAKYGIDMISQAKVLAKDKDIIKLQRFDYGYEVGFGFDFYLTYFKFSPEIKMYNGLNNLLVQDHRTYSAPLKALYSKTFLVSFNFE